MYILEKINSFLWDYILIFLLLGTGILYTFRLKFVQFRLFRFIFSRKRGTNSGLSQFKTVSMSLGTAMGTGNITGVAAALSIGGAGSVFWMWVSAFLGMAVVYAENSLSAVFSDHDIKGSPAYLKKGLKSKFMTCFFALMCIFAAFGMGGMVQVSSFAVSLETFADISPLYVAVPVFFLIFAVVSGGAKRIGTAAQFLLPAASALYIIVCILVIIKFRYNFTHAFTVIFSEAFGVRQTIGGVSGFAVSRAVSVGIRRGIFSNEAGLGSSPILHSAAESSSSYFQGMWSIAEVFIDTVLCCTLTAVTLICSTDNYSVIECFSSVLGDKAAFFVTAEIAVFAFCTIIGWYYCGETVFSFLTGKGKTLVFPAVYAFAASLGVFFSSEAVWMLSDIFNGLMAIPNLIALLKLRDKVETYKSPETGRK